MADRFEATRVPSREDLEALIRHLALVYQGGDPVFAYAEEAGFLPGYDPKVKLSLQATWDHVVGSRGPPGAGVWAQCRTCGAWAVWPETTKVVTGGD
jgi:hypothetical protein